MKRTSPVPPAPITPHVDERANSSLSFERIVFFSDAVFAIAITLLVLEIRVPEIADRLVPSGLLGRLLALWPKLLGYATASPSSPPTGWRITASSRRSSDSIRP